MTNRKIESYIERDADGDIVALKPGYDAIPHREFAGVICYGLYENEEYVLGGLHRSGTASEKKWIEDLLADINFSREHALLSQGEYEEFNSYVAEKWAGMHWSW